VSGYNSGGDLTSEFRKLQSRLSVLERAGRKAVGLVNNAGISVPSGGVGTLVTFAEALYDDIDMHSPGGSIVQVTASGLYLVTAWCRFEASFAGTSRYLELVEQGVSDALNGLTREVGPNNGVPTYLDLALTREYTGHQVQIRVGHNAGANITVRAGLSLAKIPSG
jgi:hypothetical protein